MQGTNQKRAPVYLLSVLVALAAFLVYLPSLENGFVNWDDDRYVYANPALASLSPGLILDSLTSVVLSNWHPLTMISYSLDYTFWGLNPFGFHLTNLLLHTLNASLVFLLVTTLIKLGREESEASPYTLVAATITALFFAMHPLHVESVAWVSERKDVLYSFFYLLAVGLYLRYVRTESARRLYYVAMLVVFALSLLSKAMAVTLPVVLLILDYYPLGRLKGPGRLLRMVVEKLPLFAMSAASSALTLWTFRSNDVMSDLEALPLAERCVLALANYSIYLYKLFVPLSFAPFYPIPTGPDVFTPGYLAAVAVFFALTFVSLFVLRRRKVFGAAWLYYLATLLPVAGFIQAGAHIMADRYTYLPLLGPFLLLGLGAGSLYTRTLCNGRASTQSRARQRGALLALGVFIFGLLSYKTVLQTRIWHDPMTLWTHAVDMYPESAHVAYNNRGMLHYSRGSYIEAYADFKRANNIDPAYTEPLYNIGVYHFERKELDEAVAYFMRAIETDPGYTMAYLNIGVIYSAKGEQVRAIEHYDKTLELSPEFAGAYFNRGNSYYALGEFALAAGDFTSGIEREPLNADAFNKRGAAYFKLGEYKRAIDDHTRAIELQGRFLSAYLNRANAFVKEGNPHAAIVDYRVVISLDPRHGRAYYNLGQLYLDSGEDELARSFFNMAAALGYQGALDEVAQ